MSVFVTAWMGCAANVGVENAKIPSNAARTCESQCQHIGLTMTAVAMMADTVGCICQPPAATSSRDNAGATAAGMSTIMLQRERQERQHKHHP